MKIINALVMTSMLFPAVALASDGFYERNPLRLIVGNGPGAGYDAYARLYARHVSKHIPGNPNVVVLNRPGAGSLIMMNELSSSAPRDGGTIGMPLRNIPTAELLGEPNIKFDVNQLVWLGSMNDEVSVCGVWHTHPVRQMTDLKTVDTAIGATGLNDDTAVFPNMLNRVYGSKMRVVTGYTSAAEISLAIERGEVQGRCGMSYSQLTGPNASWLKEGNFRVLLQLSLEKHKDLPDVPIVTEIVDKKYAGALKLMFARQLWGRPLVAPPNIPTDRASLLRSSFDATMKDPDFLADASKAKLEINPVSGAKMQLLIGELSALPKDVVEIARSIAR